MHHPQEGQVDWQPERYRLTIDLVHARNNLYKEAEERESRHTVESPYPPPRKMSAKHQNYKCHSHDPREWIVLKEVFIPMPEAVFGHQPNQQEDKPKQA